MSHRNHSRVMSRVTSASLASGTDPIDRTRSRAREASTSDNRDVINNGAVDMRSSISGVVPDSNAARKTADVSR